MAEQLTDTSIRRQLGYFILVSCNALEQLIPQLGYFILVSCNAREPLTDTSIYLWVTCEYC